MAVKSPIRYVFDNDGNIVEFSEFQSADFIGIGDGGTGATTASGAAVALGLEIGVDVQAYDVNLDELSALTPADSNFIVGNGTEWIVESGSTVRDSLGLGTSDAVQFNTIQTSNLTIGGPSLTLEGATDDSFESTLVVTDPTADRTITFQDASGTVALLSDVTAQDVDFAGDTGTGAVDLDSQTFTIQGTANEIETSASGQTLTIGLPDDVTIGNDLTITGNLTVQGTQTILETETLTVDDNVIVLNSNATGSATVDAGIEIERGDDSNVTLVWDETNNRWTVGLESFVASTFIGNLTGNVTGDLTGNVTATSVLADGVTATTQTAGDNSNKVATTAYVDSISVDDNLTVSDGTTSTTIDLDTQTFSILGTASQITSTTSAQTITLSLPATINVDTSGNAATATTLETARTIAGVSFDGSANIDIPIDNLSDVVITTPSTGQVLEYNGTNWVNATDDNTEYTAGDGLDLTGTVFSTDLKANGGLVIESTELALDLGASSITGSLDAAKIADGSVSDAEFQYLNGVTSAIQTQLDGKQASGSYITASSTDTLTNKTLGAVTLSGTVTGGDQEINAVVLKDYAETDVAVTSSSGVVSINLANGNTGSITLTENITDIDFTNVPTNGVSTFTLQITQDTTARTVAINAVTVNGGGNVTAKTAGGGGYTVSTGSGAIDLVTFLFLDAGTPLLNALKDFS